MRKLFGLLLISLVTLACEKENTFSSAEGITVEQLYGVWVDTLRLEPNRFYTW